MAIGLLGTGVTTGGTPVTVYTVPSGISHAVVHITFFATDNTRSVSINGVTIARAVTTVDTFTFSHSVMLSPGDVVTIEGGSGANCTVSGYEVPL